jgi:hypothetical protein
MAAARSKKFGRNFEKYLARFKVMQEKKTILKKLPVST